MARDEVKELRLELGNVLKYLNEGEEGSRLARGGDESGDKGGD